MRCIHLIRNSPTSLQLKSWIASGELPSDLLICDGNINNCPKKKQPCEINRRCWSLG